MADALSLFVTACQQGNMAASALGHPPFSTGLGTETPLNSSPYIYHLSHFEMLFGHTSNRRQLLDALRARLAGYRTRGLCVELLIVGGSFVRPDAEPNDLDGLAIYRMADSAADARLEHIAPTGKHDGVELFLCPADCHPLILVKRTIFFSNLFSFDRGTNNFDRGVVIVLPDDQAITRTSLVVETAGARR